MGVDDTSKGVRIYWPDKQNIMVEQNVYYDKTGASASHFEGEDWDDFVEMKVDELTGTSTTVPQSSTPTPNTELTPHVQEPPIMDDTEFFTVPHVFLPESAGIQVIRGIPQNGILAVLPAKIVISIPRNSGGFRNGHGITKTESTGTESPECFLIVIVIFKSNTNYLIVITVNY